MANAAQNGAGDKDDEELIICSDIDLKEQLRALLGACQKKELVDDEGRAAKNAARHDEELEDEDADTEPESNPSSGEEADGQEDLLSDTADEAEDDNVCQDEDVMALPVGVDALPKKVVKAPPIPPLPPRLQLLKKLIEETGGPCETSKLTYADFLRRLCKKAEENGCSEAARSRVSFSFRPAPVAQTYAKFNRARRVLPPIEGSIVVDDDADCTSEKEDKVQLELPKPAPKASSESAKPAKEQKAARKELEPEYKAPTAAVVLLRKYFSQERVLGTLNGELLFEADGVQYPLDTVTPLRCTPSTGSELLSLGSLFAAVSLQDKYEGQATPDFLKGLKAKKLRSAHVESLVAYLLGKTDSCNLLLSRAKAKKVSDSQPSLLNEDALGGRSKSSLASPVPLEELRTLPGQAAESEEEMQSPTEQFSSSGESTESASEETPKTTRSAPAKSGRKASPKKVSKDPKKGGKDKPRAASKVTKAPKASGATKMPAKEARRAPKEAVVPKEGPATPKAALNALDAAHKEARPVNALDAATKQASKLDKAPDKEPQAAPEDSPQEPKAAAKAPEAPKKKGMLPKPKMVPASKAAPKEVAKAAPKAASEVTTAQTNKDVPKVSKAPNKSVLKQLQAPEAAPKEVAKAAPKAASEVTTAQTNKDVPKVSKAPNKSVLKQLQAPEAAPKEVPRAAPKAASEVPTEQTNKDVPKVSKAPNKSVLKQPQAPEAAPKEVSRAAPKAASEVPTEHTNKVSNASKAPSEAVPKQPAQAPEQAKEEELQTTLRVLKRKLLGDSAILTTTGVAKLQSKLERLNLELKHFKNAESELKERCSLAVSELEAAKVKRQKFEEEYAWSGCEAEGQGGYLDRFFRNLAAFCVAHGVSSRSASSSGLRAPSKAE